MPGDITQSLSALNQALDTDNIVGGVIVQALSGLNDRAVASTVNYVYYVSLSYLTKESLSLNYKYRKDITLG